MFILVNTLTLEEAIVFFLSFFFALFLIFAPSDPTSHDHNAIIHGDTRTGYDHGHSALQVATRDIWRSLDFQLAMSFPPCCCLKRRPPPPDVSG